MQQAEQANSRTNASTSGGTVSNLSEVILSDPFGTMGDVVSHSDVIDSLIVVSRRMLGEAIAGEIYKDAVPAHLQEVQNLLIAAESLYRLQADQLNMVERALYHHHLPEVLRSKAA